MVTPPRVFISYSHDSAEHKGWVLDFAATLRNRGVDAILDQWDLKPGDDLPHFMERSLDESDFVVMVCTKNYVMKANSGAGGVGYEKMIMTSAYLTRIDESKVIPIIRQAGTNARPTFMQSKLYVDFSKDEEVEYSFDELLRVLLNAPLYEKPEIGTNPFKPMESSRPNRTSDNFYAVMSAVATAFERSASDKVSTKELLQVTSMRRLVVDRYINQAIKDGYLRVAGSHITYGRYFNLTSKGNDYLFEAGIVEE
ncbi:toll/interleukin-1 receptor domain-containing protein [Photobacterium sp. Hal280]|uniref:toll/interleukin-1 receptor domain-containing protein n=1 Tax=Photobacterium sp. Hal280 TaxID=3035163 RepID=UPI00301C5761